MHPAVERLLKYFKYDHLPQHLQVVSRKFHELAHDIAHTHDCHNPEVTVALRKLLESKDAAVRSMI